MRSRWHNAPRNEPCRAAVQGVPGRLSIAAATITTARYICCADRLRSSRSSGLSIVWKEEKNISKCSFVICNLLFLSSFFLLTLILLHFFFISMRFVRQWHAFQLALNASFECTSNCFYFTALSSQTDACSAWCREK